MWTMAWENGNRLPARMKIGSNLSDCSLVYAQEITKHVRKKHYVLGWFVWLFCFFQTGRVSKSVFCVNALAVLETVCMPCWPELTEIWLLLLPED